MRSPFSIPRFGTDLDPTFDPILISFRVTCFLRFTYIVDPTFDPIVDPNWDQHRHPNWGSDLDSNVGPSLRINIEFKFRFKVGGQNLILTCAPMLISISTQII